MSGETLILVGKKLEDFFSSTKQIGSIKGASIRYRESDNTYWSLSGFSAMKLSNEQVECVFK